MDRGLRGFVFLLHRDVSNRDLHRLAPAIHRLRRSAGAKARLHDNLLDARLRVCRRRRDVSGRRVLGARRVLVAVVLRDLVRRSAARDRQDLCREPGARGWRARPIAPIAWSRRIRAQPGARQEHAALSPVKSGVCGRWVRDPHRPDFFSEMFTKISINHSWFLASEQIL